MKYGLRFDMRAPSFGPSPQTLYAAALEQVAWADAHGFDLVGISEHHGSDDGYCPSPTVLGAAFAGRSSGLRIRLSVLLLPLYDPVKAAEDLAVLDLASGGRLEVVVGAGYRAAEFAMFGRQLRQRPRLIEQGVATLKQAWTGEPFEHHGVTIRVTPRPLQRPRPLLLLGGSSGAAARRAARIADGFVPTEARFLPFYLEERARLGLDPGRTERRAGPPFVYVSEDPDEDWARIAPFALHETNSYAQWLSETGGGIYAPAESAEALRASGAYRVLTPDECVALLRAEEAQGATQFILHPLMGGMDPALGWSSLELFAAKVLPRLCGPALA